MQVQGCARSCDQRVQVIVLGEHGGYTGAERRQFQFPAVVRGEQEKRNLGHHAAKSGGGFQAVHFRHREVENDQVGTELLGFLNGVNTVNRLAANGELRMRVEKQTELATNDFVIVNEQD